MSDLFTAHELVMQAVQHSQHVPVPIPRPQVVQTGVSYMDSILSSAIAGLIGAGLGGGLGWYVRGRGMTGVQMDLANVKSELLNVKNILASKTVPQAVTVVTPAPGTAAPATTPAVAPTH